MVQKAYKFQLYPNKEQREYFAKTFGCVRFVYNRMLAEKIAYYEETRKSLSVTPAKYKTEFPWLKEVDSLALANAQMNLQSAYRNFFVINQWVFLNTRARKTIIEPIQQTIRKVQLRLLGNT